MAYTKAAMGGKLPPIRCSEDLMERALNYAKEKQVSLADVQRKALSLFLSNFYSDAIEECSDAIEKEKQCSN